MSLLGCRHNTVPVLGADAPIQIHQGGDPATNGNATITVTRAARRCANTEKVLRSPLPAPPARLNGIAATVPPPATMPPSSTMPSVRQKAPTPAGGTFSAITTPQSSSASAGVARMRVNATQTVRAIPSEHLTSSSSSAPGAVAPAQMSAAPGAMGSRQGSMRDSPVRSRPAV